MWTSSNLDQVPNYFTYRYEHLDDLAFLRDPTDVFLEHGCEEDLSAWLKAVGDLLSDAGWEGDGDLRILWFPPFADIGVEDTYGTYVWVVKQQNNGESFIASHIELPFARLRAQNDLRAVWSGRVARSVTRGDTEAFRTQIAEERKSLEADLAAVGTTLTSVRSRIAEHSHARLVQHFQAYLDDCYLQVLQEALIRGNPSGLKLRKSSVRLAPTDYLPGSHDGDQETGTWFTLHGIVSDMWHAFMFEPFDSKADMLFRPLEYRPTEHLAFELRKGVQIRNAFQHHAGQLKPDLLRRLGRDRLELLGDDGSPVHIEPWKTIELSGAEALAFAQHLDDFAVAFESHIEVAVKSRVYMNP